MSTVLKDMQFEILPYAEAETGIPFGIGLEVSVDADGFQPGGPDWYTEDSENPFNGAIAFGGSDHTIGTPWQWVLHVNRDNASGALSSLGRLATAWRAGKNLGVGESCAIRYQLDGRIRRIFGRPRRFEYSPNNLMLGGLIPVQADFRPVDACTYDDIETAFRMELQTDPLGGLRFPVVLPQALLPSGNQDGQALVLGDADTYPVIRFEGPVVNPSIECEQWALKLGGNTAVPTFALADGEFVEIDTRPWAQTVLFNGDTSVAGALGKRQWLSNMFMSPGNYDFRFGGASSSTGAACEVRWRSAWNSI